MISLLVGKKGSGKTKKLIDLANNAVENSSGNVVVIEKGNKLTYDVNHDAKLVNIDLYKIKNFESLFGFICGMCAGNYDITDMFIDSTLKIAGENLENLADFIGKLDSIMRSANVKLTILLSMDEMQLPSDINAEIQII